MGVENPSLPTLIGCYHVSPMVTAMHRSSRATRKPVILVVDDEPSVSQTLAWLLRENGYNSMFCLNAKTALDIAKGVAADVAIVDVMLPDGDGIETALQLQKCVPNCKILLITGNMEGSDRILQARANGIAFDALPKPVGIRELFGALSQLTGSSPKANA